MRYITNDSGYLLDVSFGADIVCGGKECAAYTGSIPDGYSSLADWYMQECDKLYRWKVVGGELTLDGSATAPEVEWENPPMLAEVEYRTTERWLGRPVYTYVVCFDNLFDNDINDRMVPTFDNTTIIDVRAVALGGLGWYSPDMFGRYVQVNGGQGRVQWDTMTQSVEGNAGYVVVKYVKNSNIE